MNTERQHGLWFHLFDVGLNIVIILAVVGVIRTFLVSPFQVEGKSMVSTLEHKEYIIINKLVYRLDIPQRGDIIVFRPPNDPSKPYVKRIIGLPGDSVVIEGGIVYVQPAGSDTLTAIDEPYLNGDNAGHTYRAPPSSGNTSRVSYHVPDGQYFVLGDNRTGSLDSRSFRDASGTPVPYVAREAIIGKVWVIALPLSKMQVFESPHYEF